MRTGIGIDVHQFADGVPMWVAGIHFPEESSGLAGHSDGDVVSHAICDALLSAAGLGDLGSNYGTSDPRWAGASGVAFLRETQRRLHEAGWQIINVAVQMIGQRPRLLSRREEAQVILCEALGGSPVSVSATTTDHMGFTGRGEGLAAIATVLIEKISDR